MNVSLETILLAVIAASGAILGGAVAFFKLRPENRKTNTDSISVLVETSGKAVLIWKGIVEERDIGIAERDTRIERAERRLHDLEERRAADRADSERRIHDLEAQAAGLQKQVAGLLGAGKAVGQELRVAEGRVDHLSDRVEVLENELSSHGIPIPPTTEDSPDPR